MRKKILVGSAGAIIFLVIVAVALFVQAPSTPIESPAPGELPPEEIPPNLLVIPEVPLGTLAVVLACLSAFVISQLKSKARLK